MRACLLFLALSLLPADLIADTGDVALGPMLSGGWPAEGRLGATVRFGVGDWLALDVRLGAAVDEHGVLGVGSAGVIAAWDVLAWVPELRLAGGARVAEAGVDPRVIAELGVRHYLGLELSLLISVGGEWTPELWSGVASVGLLFDL